MTTSPASAAASERRPQILAREGLITTFAA